MERDVPFLATSNRKQHNKEGHIPLPYVVVLLVVRTQNKNKNLQAHLVPPAGVTWVSAGWWQRGGWVTRKIPPLRFEQWRRVVAGRGDL